MIDFTRSFDSAWERMQVILFRPFDIGKWFAIGLGAFLAGLVQGGNGFNSTPNSNSLGNLIHPSHAPTVQNNASLHDIIAKMLAPTSGMNMGIFLVAVAVGMVIGLGFLLLIGWLGARGQFLFLDNIVRNRGAISWPWSHYARQANSFFLVYLLIILVSCLIIIPVLAIVVVMCIPLYQQDRWPTGGEVGGFVALGLIYLLCSTVLAVFMFLFREFGAAIMFRQGITARPALGEMMKILSRHPGSVAVFVLLRIAIFIGVIVLSIVLYCVTCCIGALPYIGTVILLPVLIFVKCFTLDCLAQFGPEYDVFTIDVAASPPPDAWPGNYPPPSPPPPL